MRHFLILPLVAAMNIASVPSAAAQFLDGADHESIGRKVDRLAPSLAALSQDIWKYAELGFQEHKSVARIEADLKKAGFHIEKGIAGIPTAFVASAGSGGPVIAVLAEYDALPGLSQAVSTERQPVAGQAAGHACGHNLLGAGSVTAAIALKQWLQETGTPGTIRLYGTPAEEGGAAKVYMVRDGLFKDVDITLSWHPGDSNGALQGQLLAVIGGKFRFSGVPSHAAVAPERGRSALDGAEIMNISVNYLREHVPQDSRIHYTISHGGEQPNIVPASAENFYYVRHYDPKVAQDIWRRVTLAAQGAAQATETQVTSELIQGSYSTLPNYSLGRVADHYLRILGGYEYSPDEAEFARKLAVSLPAGAVRDGAGPSGVQPFVEGVRTPASSDVGDVSWVTPTVQITTATYVAGTPPHSWQAVAASGSSIGVKGTVLAAKVLALTGADLFRNPDKITAAKEEFEKRRGPDFRYQALIGDRKPALDYMKK